MLISYDKKAMGFFQETINHRWIRMNADVVFDLRSFVNLTKALKIFEYAFINFNCFDFNCELRWSF